MIYSWLSRRSTARGSSTGLVPVGSTKVKAQKSFPFTEGTSEVEVLNKFAKLRDTSYTKNAPIFFTTLPKKKKDVCTKFLTFFWQMVSF